MINRYYKVFELVEIYINQVDDEPITITSRQEIFEDEVFGSKAEIKRLLDATINDTSREFVIEEVFTVEN